MPTCSHCSWHPEMKLVRTKPFIDLPGTPGMRMQMNHRMRQSGHPGIALAAMLFGGAAFVANQFLVEREYKCAFCDRMTSETHAKP